MFSFLNFLKINQIPTKNWSSKSPLNFKPSFKTLFFLSLGLIIFGLGEGLILISSTGNSPWLVLAEGLSIKTGMSVGSMTFFISLMVLCLWIFLNQKPGVGTLLNVLIIAVVIDLTTFYFNPPTSVYFQYLLTIIAVLLVGLGSGIYLVANLGPGPRDGLMTGLTKISGYPISLVRASLEITVVVVGWYFGGTVGLGTLIFAFGIGPAVSLGLYIVNKF
ncbi:MAG: hypothetical protein O2959_05525 [Proteobacteria bacterium]|nr:hypothetical protein [Pseudomonadota bacterium]MDA1034998.1 hypothetical protein [Pseudomonadota bacterium]